MKKQTEIEIISDNFKKVIERTKLKHPEMTNEQLMVKLFEIMLNVGFENKCSVILGVVSKSIDNMTWNMASNQYPGISFEAVY